MLVIEGPAALYKECCESVVYIARDDSGRYEDGSFVNTDAVNVNDAIWEEFFPDARPGCVGYAHDAGVRLRITVERL
jgi:hypothetical protein